ncbi:hypothetical protein H4219_006390 [Mycoemilia scoparia]|uniref:Uncharacterized protein n=1 Tax=Mycoemilia scoparia TaxID=417184 RepID=A0A9W8DHL7_9FUNG|nr:hypothetical protein H4219_006390 [Mycoemilia scoparia]
MPQQTELYQHQQYHPFDLDILILRSTSSTDSCILFALSLTQPSPKMKFSLSSVLLCSAAVLLSSAAADPQPFSRRNLNKRGSVSSDLTKYGYSAIADRYSGQFLRASEFDRYASKALSAYLDDESSLNQDDLDHFTPGFVSSMEFAKCDLKKDQDTKSQIKSCIKKIGKMTGGSDEYKYVAVAFSKEAGLLFVAKCDGEDEECPNGKQL